MNQSVNLQILQLINMRFIPRVVIGADVIMWPRYLKPLLLTIAWILRLRLFYDCTAPTSGNACDEATEHGNTTNDHNDDVLGEENGKGICTVDDDNIARSREGTGACADLGGESKVRGGVAYISYVERATSNTVI